MTLRIIDTNVRVKLATQSQKALAEYIHLADEVDFAVLNDSPIHTYTKAFFKESFDEYSTEQKILIAL